MYCNLKFCYFFVLILLVSCGSDTSKNNKTNTSTTSESNEAETNTNKTILFFGDSLTAGFGLDDENDAFPGLIQNTIDSLQLNYTVINSGLSGETTSGGRSRLNWVIMNQPIDIFVLELGANDGLRGIPLSETRENLQIMIDLAKKKNPDIKIVLAGMQLPPNIGQDYTTEFKNIFPELAQKNDTYLIPFLLENVGGIPKLNQADGIHPTVEGQKIVAENVWNILKPLLNI